MNGKLVTYPALEIITYHIKLFIVFNDNLFGWNFFFFLFFLFVTLWFDWNTVTKLRWNVIVDQLLWLDDRFCNSSLRLNDWFGKDWLLIYEVLLGLLKGIGYDWLLFKFSLSFLLFLVLFFFRLRKLNYSIFFSQTT